MHWLLLVGFITAHFLIYLVVVRHLQVFAREGMIVFYHAVAFSVVFAIVVVGFARGVLGFAGACGLIALQFIYSMSFLELWTLTEGSYSLQILLLISRRGSLSRQDIVATSEAIGAQKKHQRINDLLSLKLISKSGDGRFELSMAGWILVRSLRGIMRLAGVRAAD